MRELHVVLRCDLCGAEFEEANGRLDVTWSWGGRSLMFDADQDCLSNRSITVGHLLDASRPAGDTRPAKPREPRRRGSRVRLEQYYRAGFYSVNEDGSEVWLCRMCDQVFPSRAKIDGHYRGPHGTSLKEVLEQARHPVGSKA